MGSIGSHVATGYVFPAPDSKYTTKDNAIELLPTDIENYSIPFTHIQTKDPRALLFYSHGNAEDLYSVVDYLKDVSKELNVDVISWDFAGYGLHKTLDNVKPSEENVYDDATKMFAYVQIQADNKNIPIIVYGRSLGSAPAIYVAAKYKNEVAGLVVESGFRSIARVVSNTLHNIYDLFDNELVIQSQTTIPTLFIHGKQDHVVPFSHGQHLYEVCPCEKKYSFWIPNGHHNDIDSTYKSELFIRLNSFIEQLI